MTGMSNEKETTTKEVCIAQWRLSRSLARSRYIDIGNQQQTSEMITLRPAIFQTPWSATAATTALNLRALKAADAAWRFAGVQTADFIISVSSGIRILPQPQTNSKQTISLDGMETLSGAILHLFIGQAEVWPRLVALAVALLAMQILLLTFRRLHRHKTFERMQISGPKPNLIHGHLYETRRQAYVKFAAKMHEQYGDNVGVYLGGDPYLITKDLELIQQVFVAKSRLFYDRMDFYLNVDPVPDNLICQRGDRWRYMRKLLTPAFSNSKIRSSHFYHDTQKTIAKFSDQLEQNSRLNPTSGRRETVVDDLYDRMAAIALDVIVKTAFHMDNMISFKGSLSLNVEASLRQQGKFGSLNGKLPGASDKAAYVGPTDVFLNTVKRACRLGFNPLVELIFCFPVLDGPLTYLCNRLYFSSILKLLMNRLDYLVRRSNNSPKQTSDDVKLETGPIIGQTKPADQQQLQRKRIIDSLIEVLRERKITRSEFTGNAFVIVFAGFETTANALTFTLWLLARDQRVQAKLRQELQQQIKRVTDKSTKSARSNQTSEASDGDRHNDDDEDAKLTELATGCSYLEMVINESLRLYPPVPGLSCRQASADCKLSNGLAIEKGVNVVPSVFTIHRDKNIWGEEANLFKPERFEMLDDAQLNSAMFMPFGLGPRNCIGKAVAMHEMKISIGRLILDYSIEPVAGKTPEKLKLCSPINITITSAHRIGLKFVKL